MGNEQCYHNWIEPNGDTPPRDRKQTCPVFQDLLRCIVSKLSQKIENEDSQRRSLWIAKCTVSEFLKRLTSQVWNRSYEIGLQFIRWFLIITFVAVVIATLSECRPFYKYWQVVPDPGAKCRQGYAQLITMGASNVSTDVLLVAFPIPIILKSHMALKRKISLVTLFALSLILVAITIYRVVGVIDRNSDQQFRSLLASLEILAAAAVSNALVLGSFVRDRGAKKQRYRIGSTGGASSLNRSTEVHRNIISSRTWGSDTDLAGDLGMRLGPEFEDQQPRLPRPAPIALPLASQARNVTPKAVLQDWTFPTRGSAETDETDLKAPSLDTDKEAVSPGEISAPILTPRRMSFFDVGGLLEDDHAAPSPRYRSLSVFGSPALPPHAEPIEPETQQTRRGSHTLLQDIGGLLSPSHPSPPSPHSVFPSPRMNLQPTSSTRQFSQPTPPPVRNFSRPTSPCSSVVPSPHQQQAEFAAGAHPPLSTTAMPPYPRSPGFPASPQPSVTSSASSHLHPSAAQRERQSSANALKDVGGLLT